MDSTMNSAYSTGVAASWAPAISFGLLLVILAVALLGVLSPALAAMVFTAGFCMSGAQTGLNAYAPGCYPTLARATGVSWMLGMGRFGSILGSSIGGVLLAMGWGFTSVVSLLAIPASARASAARSAHCSSIVCRGPLNLRSGTWSAMPTMAVRVVDGDPADGAWLALYRRGDRLIGALGVSKIRALMGYHRLLEGRAGWSEALAQAGIS